MKKPVLVVVDIQKEYITPDRPFCLAGIGPSLANAERVLRHARQNGWQVIHVQHLQPSKQAENSQSSPDTENCAIFSADNEFSDFIPGFAPEAGESIAVKSDFSSYSSPAYRELLAACEGRDLYLLGYGSTMCCLATIVDGYHRGHRYRFIADASWSKKSELFTEAARHAHAVDVLRTFCEIRKTEEIV